MNRGQMKLGLVFVVCVGFLVVASVRVQGFLGTARNTKAEVAEDLSRGAALGHEPNLDEVHVLKDEDMKSIRLKIKNRMKSVLERMEGDDRLSDYDIDRLVQSAEDYIIFNQTATLEDVLERYRERDIDIPPEFVQDDSERAHRAWVWSTSWSRYKPINIESIEFAPLFLNGRLVGQLWAGVGPIKSRRMSNGRFLLEDSAGFTVYEMTVKCVMPVRSRRDDIEATVSILFINDGDKGAWSSISAAYLDVPDGVRISIPYP